MASIDKSVKTGKTDKADKADKTGKVDKAESAGRKALPYIQNRELSWLAFNERCLDQGADKTVPPLERLKFVSIFWSNLQEFFMVRVGSLTDLSLLKKPIIDAKSQMTPAEQIEAIHARCHELYEPYERTFRAVEGKLSQKGIVRLEPDQLDDEQRSFIELYAKANILPYLAPQVINVHHPFPHLENGALYVVASLTPAFPEGMPDIEQSLSAAKSSAPEAGKKKGSMSVTVGIIPVPGRCERVIKLPGSGFRYILVEHVVEMLAPEVFSMYRTKRTNIICVTRNADLDALEGVDEEIDFREHMKKILKKRGRLAPVRLDLQRKPTTSVLNFLLERLSLDVSQCYTSAVPLDMSYAFGLPSAVGEELASPLTYEPFTPAWSRKLQQDKPLFPQIEQHDVLCTYPYESMDTFLTLIREAVFDPDVVSIKITLYRLATKSRLADLLIAAAEAGKDVTTLFELRARFDEGNNITWSQRCEEAGCKVVYGFRDYKVHSKLCLITRKTDEGMRYITQIGTGNYNEKTASLYTDYSFITADQRIGEDAVEFFQNVGLEAIADTYKHLCVAPIQIKRLIMQKIDEQIEHVKAGEPCGLFFKTNSVTDFEIIKKIEQASCAGVPVTMFVRGISCLVPGVKGHTENVRIVSVVGRLLEHSRIYAFGPLEAQACELYISSADLMTRNMDRRVEVACPIYDESLRAEIIDQMNLYLHDTVKRRELQSTRLYTPLGAFTERDEQGKKIRLDAQEALIERMSRAAEELDDDAPIVVEKGAKMKVAGLGGSASAPSAGLEDGAPVASAGLEDSAPVASAGVEEIMQEVVSESATEVAPKPAFEPVFVSSPEAETVPAVQSESEVVPEAAPTSVESKAVVTRPSARGIFAKIKALFKR